jgi:hypothetical protein
MSPLPPSYPLLASLRKSGVGQALWAAEHPARKSKAAGNGGNTPAPAVYSGDGDAGDGRAMDGGEVATTP